MPRADTNERPKLGRPSRGRANQKTRTRKELLQAAARLLKQGRRPTIEDVAEEALVSRATAYRYFPSVEALLVEASVDVAVPDAADLFGKTEPADPVLRLEWVDAALHKMIAENEVPLRMMLAQSIERRAREPGSGGQPVRQNRRTPLIEAALAPARDRFWPSRLDTLSKALALVIGTEAMVVFRDVLQLRESEARRVRRWVIRALVEAALAQSAEAGRRG